MGLITIKKIRLLALLLAVSSCNNKPDGDLKLTRNYELRTRKTYSYLNESQQDSVSRANPELADQKLEKAGLIKDGKLQLDRFKSTDLALLNNTRKSIGASYSYDKTTAQPKILLIADSFRKEYPMKGYEIGHQFMMAKGNIIDGGFEEIVTIDKYYLVNGENFDLTVWEIK
jgi:hypothetical protein